MIKKAIAVLCVCLPSFVTCMLYKLIGYKIGKNSRIPIFSFVYADKIELGNDVDIRPFVFISVSRLSLGHNAIISFGTQIFGRKSFQAKDNTFVGVQCLIHCEEDVKIGFYSGLGPRCIVYTHGSFLPVTKGYPAKFEPVVLEDYVWTGMSVVYLPGTYIEENCIINPGVVVDSRIASNTLLKLAPGSFQRIKLEKLQKYFIKSNKYYLEEMLKQFLDSENCDYTHEKQNNLFILNSGDSYCYNPSENVIFFKYNGLEIKYDFENYFAEKSSYKLHRRFLFFIRRRFGVILRTIYE